MPLRHFRAHIHQWLHLCVNLPKVVYVQQSCLFPPCFLCNACTRSLPWSPVDTAIAYNISTTDGTCFHNVCFDPGISLYWNLKEQLPSSRWAHEEIKSLSGSHTNHKGSATIRSPRYIVFKPTTKRRHYTEALKILEAFRSSPGHSPSCVWVPPPNFFSVQGFR